MKNRPSSTLNVARINTPCYVCEESLLDYNLSIFDDIQKKSGAKILVALKGFALWSTFGKIKQALVGAAASGLYEARLAYEEIGGETHTYTPAFPDGEFDEIMGYSSHIIFNSFQQWKKFRWRVMGYPRKISCGIRVNPEYSEIKTDLYNPCAKFSRFGVRINEFDGMALEGISGIHFHTHFEHNADVLERGLKIFESKFGKFIPRMKWVNFGGGHLITDCRYDRQRLIDIIRDFRSKYGVEVYLEPGEAVGWQTGVLVAGILDIFESEGQKIAILDASFETHMPDCLAMPYDPTVRGARKAGELSHEYRFGGNTCLAGDVTRTTYSFDSPLSVGDKIIFEDMIHYTIVKNTTFNGAKLPSIAVWTKDKTLKVVREFGYETYKYRNS